MTLLVGSKSCQPNTGHHTETQACDASPPANSPSAAQVAADVARRQAPAIAGRRSSGARNPGTRRARDSSTSSTGVGDGGRALVVLEIRVRCGCERSIDARPGNGVPAAKDSRGVCGERRPELNQRRFEHELAGLEGLAACRAPRLPRAPAPRAAKAPGAAARAASARPAQREVMISSRCGSCNREERDLVAEVILARMQRIRRRARRQDSCSSTV